MTNRMMRKSLLAAVSALALAAAFTPTAKAQQAAALSAANPELAAKGAWDPATTYVIDDIVTARGSAWISLKANNKNRVPGQTQPSTATYWQLFARGFNPTGAWSNATKYQADDLVTHLGQSWRAKRTVAAGGATPAANANWELLAAKGAEGDDGAQGLQGIQGIQGIQGPAGPNTGIDGGSASAPSFSFSGDSNTGIYSPGADKIALVEGGTLFLHNLGTNNAALGLGALANGGGLNNTAVGSNALANPTGGGNTAVGNLALNANTTAVNNTAVGDAALTLTVGGSNNAAVGASALASNTSGASNVAIGTDALFANTTQGFNTAVGYQAMRNAAASSNTAVGTLALGNATGNENTAIGAFALRENLAGFRNTAIGMNALSANTEGADNIGIGASALTSNTTGGTNHAFGTDTLRSNTDGASNVAVGHATMYFNTSGSNNVAIGREALFSNTTGANNVAVGKSAGDNAAAPDYSIFIGNSGASLDTLTIKIGSHGQQQTTFMAGIAGVQAGDAPVYVDSTTGQLGIGPAPSSRRLKYDIEAMADMSALLSKLRPVTYRYKHGKSDGSHPLQYGLIAEEVAELNPDLAMFDQDGQPNGVKYHLLPSFLLAGYQAQQKLIVEQATKIDAQAGQMRQQQEVNASLEARLARLEAAMPQGRAAALRQ